MTLKPFTAGVLLLAVTGCTAMRAVDDSPSELQQRINSGELLKPGERVWIVTVDEKSHRFVVGRVEAGLIVGPNESVPVDQVMYLEKRQFQKIESPVSFSFDKEVAVDSLIAIAAFALRPSSVDETP
jgi:hypothetical protein